MRRVIEAAFGRSDEADLVDALRRSGDALVSLVAEIDGGVAGHVLFSRMWIEGGGPRIPAVALAPVAVAPAYQRCGAGRAMIEHGLKVLRERGERIVIVVGHAAYYPKFGFSTAMAAGLDAPFSRESFMALELVAGAFDGVRGRVVYPAAFGI